MRTLFILLLFFIAKVSIAQEAPALQGKWNITAVSQVISESQDSLYYDMQTDSIYIPKEDLLEAYKDGLDSIQTVNLFKYMFGSFKESSFTFERDSVILDLKSTKAIGTFKIKGADTLDINFIHEDGKHDNNILALLKHDPWLLKIKRQKQK